MVIFLFFFPLVSLSLLDPLLRGGMQKEPGDLGVSTPGQTIVSCWDGGRGLIVSINRRRAGGGGDGVLKT